MKKPLKKVISLIKEQMVANAAGTGGGFGGSADAKGPTAGFDPVMKPRKRYIYQRGLRKKFFVLCLVSLLVTHHLIQISNWQINL